jgi:hypothetical protein
MRHAWWFLLVAAAAGCGPSAGEPSAQGADAGRTVVDLDGLKSTAPSAWKEEKPSNAMRFMQFKLPHVDGDKTDAELIVFKGFGGSAAQNVQRWKDQFLPPEGKTIDQVSEVKHLKVSGAEATYLDIHGTYKASMPGSGAAPVAHPDYRMLAVHFDGPKNVYHIKLTGPAKTVDHYKKGFDDWLMGFK